VAVEDRQVLADLGEQAGEQVVGVGQDAGSVARSGRPVRARTDDLSAAQVGYLFRSHACYA
jgi:hypothetical protein